MPKKTFFLALIVYIIYFVHQLDAWNIPYLNIKLPSFQRDSYNPFCYAKECCNKDWINFKRERLKANLTKHVFGQPLLETALNALSAHFSSAVPPQKPLTLSFHGMTGTGKNYVSNFIVDSIYRKGSKSKYVHHFIGQMHFSEQSRVHEYRHYLYTTMKGNIQDCAKQLFIFDEVDKMIPDVLNSIKPMLDHRDDVDGVDYSQAVFIFLSNTGADVIREHYQDLYINEGRNRADMKMSDFETYIQKGAFNEKGGFHHGDVITNNLIDHYIPFLPLEESHVIKCIEREFEMRGVTKPQQDHVKEVMQFVEWGPDNTRMFSKTGCKRLGAKVALLVDKYYRYYSGHHDEL